MPRSLLAHLDAAYNLARWLTRNDQDARDCVQEAYAKALASHGQLRGDERAWLLTIVRNCCYTWLGKKRVLEPIDEDTQAGSESNPEEQVLRRAEEERVRAGLSKLATEYREVLVLRELEELSYEEISVVIDRPLGTVMSRLSRARGKLVQILERDQMKEVPR